MATTTTITSKEGLTWNFLNSVTYGTYLNGDYWVVGPLSISSITPAPSVRSNDTVKNCTILANSIATSSQGLDGSLDSLKMFDSSLNVASGIGALTPLVISPGDRIITVSAQDLFPPILKASVLTCVSADVPTLSLRPGYTDGTIDYIAGSSLITSHPYKIASIIKGTDFSAVGHSLPTANAIISSLSSFWFDPYTGIIAPEFRPLVSMPYKDFNIAAAISNAALSLNFSNTYTSNQLSSIVTHLAQIGIDNYSNLVNLDAYWAGQGSVGSGKKFPILFAGVIADIEDMVNIGITYPPELGQPSRFTEDNSTFFIASGASGINYGYGEYEASDIGNPEWGTTHWSDPQFDSYIWLNTASYGTDDRRFFTMKNWAGYLMAAKAMGLQGSWNHPALFSYFNRYYAKEYELSAVASSFQTTLAPEGMDWHFDYVSSLNSEYFPSDSNSQLSSVEYHGISNTSGAILYCSAEPVSGELLELYSINKHSLTSALLLISAKPLVGLDLGLSSIAYLPKGNPNIVYFKDIVSNSGGIVKHKFFVDPAVYDNFYYQVLYLNSSNGIAESTNALRYSTSGF